MTMWVCIRMMAACLCAVTLPLSIGHVLAFPTPPNRIPAIKDPADLSSTGTVHRPASASAIIIFDLYNVYNIDCTLMVALGASCKSLAGAKWLQGSWVISQGPSSLLRYLTDLDGRPPFRVIGPNASVDKRSGCWEPRPNGGAPGDARLGTRWWSQSWELYSNVLIDRETYSKWLETIVFSPPVYTVTVDAVHVHADDCRFVCLLD